MPIIRGQVARPLMPRASTSVQIQQTVLGSVHRGSIARLRVPQLSGIDNENPTVDVVHVAQPPTGAIERTLISNLLNGKQGRLSQNVLKRQFP